VSGKLSGLVFRSALRKPRYSIQILRLTQAAFTLIEMMAASTVLSLVLLLMVGMQDQMSRAWTNANRRTDATREARAAFQVISSDLGGLFTRQKTNMAGYPGSIAITNAGLPFVYSSNGVNPAGLKLPANLLPNSPFLFGVSSRKPSAANALDLAVFGYYIAQTNTTNLSGFVTTNYNLYRYTLDSSGTLAALAGGDNPLTLFPAISSNSEILARNACGLRFLFYNSTDSGKQVTNGANYRVFAPCTANFYSGSKIHVELSIYPEDAALKLPLSAWTNSANLQKYARSFEFRVDLPRTITH